MALALGFYRGAPAVANRSIEQGRVPATLCPARTLRGQMARLGRCEPREAIGPGLLVAVMAYLDDVNHRDRATAVDRRAH